MHMKKHDNFDIQRDVSAKFTCMSSQWGDKKVIPIQSKKVCEGSGVYLHSFLTSSLDGEEWEETKFLIETGVGSNFSTALISQEPWYIDSPMSVCISSVLILLFVSSSWTGLCQVRNCECKQTVLARSSTCFLAWRHNYDKSSETMQKTGAVCTIYSTAPLAQQEIKSCTFIAVFTARWPTLKWSAFLSNVQSA